MILSYLNLSAFLIYFYLGGTILLSDRKNKLNQAFAQFLSCFALWSFSNYFVQNIQISSDVAFLFLKIGSPGWILFAPFLLRFVAIYFDSPVLKYKKLMISIFIVGLILILFQAFGLIVIGARFTKYGSNAIWSWDIFTWLAIIYIFGSIVFSFAILIIYIIFPVTNIKKRYAQSLFITGLLAFISGLFTDFILPFWLDVAFPNFVHIIMVVWAFAGVWAVKRGFFSITPLNTYKTIITNMKDALILTDNNGVVIEANNAATQLVGDGSNIIGFKINKFVMRNNLTNPDGKVIKYIIKTKKNRKIPVKLSKKRIVNTKGKSLGIIFIIKNMTKFVYAKRKLKRAANHLSRNKEELKALEQEVKELFKIKKNKSFAKTHFLEKVDQQIRTVLNNVTGNAQLLLLSNLNSIQEEYLEIINYSSEILLNYFNELLDITAIEEDVFVENPEIINIRQFLKGICDVFMPLSREKGIYLKWVVDHSVQEQLYGDGKRLAQILINLIGNSMKFTKEGGITISVEPLFVTTEKEIRLKFFIQDTGVGIPKSKLYTIFEKFRQVDNHFVLNNSGSGLGLNITKEIILKLGGEIGITSSENQGTTFWFTLNFSEEQKNHTRTLKGEER